MQPYELKKHIFSENKIEYVLESIGIHSIKEYTNEFRCATPDYEGSNNCSVKKNEYLNISIYTSKKTIVGDIFVLLDYVKGYTFIEALRYLHDIMGLDIQKTTKKVEVDSEVSRFLSITKKYKTAKIRNEEESEQTTYTDEFMKDMIYLPYAGFFKEGIIARSQMKFGVRYDESSNRVIFPWLYPYDMEMKKYVGATARTVVKNWKELGIPKYMALPYNFSKTRNLYGYLENYSGIQMAEKVIVFEGEKSVIKADSYGYQCAVAIGGHDISLEQIALLESMNVEIIIAFDKDVSESHVIETAKKMSKGRIVSYIFDSEDLTEDKDSPIDKGRVVFKKLLDERRMVRN